MNKSSASIRRIFLVPLSILGVLDIVLIIVLVTRLTATTQAREHEAEKLMRDKASLEQALKPFQDIDKKLPEAREDIKKFYAERMPEYYSTLSEQLNKLSKEEGIQLSSIAYVGADPATEHVAGATATTKLTSSNTQPIRITTAITGDYTKLIRFINALERDKTFFIIEKLSLAGQGGGPGPNQNQNQGTVSLQISLLTYMRKT